MTRDDFVQPIVSPTLWPVERPNPYDVMVVGAGLTGAVMAERLARGSGKRVLIVDRRSDLPGTGSPKDAAFGICHRTSGEAVDYLSRFTEWRPCSDVASATDRHGSADLPAVPAEGYCRMFERMLDHPGIDLLLGVDYADVREAYPHDRLIFTGSIDEYFECRLGTLPRGSVRLHDEAPEQDDAVTNGGFPLERGSEGRALFRRYEALALAETGVIFVGGSSAGQEPRLDQVVVQALSAYRRLSAPRPTRLPEAASAPLPAGEPVPAA